MAVDNQTWEHWLERVYNLRRDKQGSHERPHKPALLLSIIDLLDRGVILENLVPFSDELVRTFKRYFEVVRASNDTPTIENPFYFLSGDKFWQVSLRNSSEPLYREGYASAAPSVGQLRDQGVAGRFADGFWSLLRSWLRPHRGIAQEKLPAYLGFFQLVHNARRRGKALLATLIAGLVATAVPHHPETR